MTPSPGGPACQEVTLRCNSPSVQGSGATLSSSNPTLKAYSICLCHCGSSQIVFETDRVSERMIAFTEYSHVRPCSRYFRVSKT